MNVVQIFIVSEAFLGKESSEVGGNSVAQPKIRPPLHCEETAEKLLSDRHGHSFSCYVHLVHNRRSVQQVHTKKIEITN